MNVTLETKLSEAMYNTDVREPLQKQYKNNVIRTINLLCDKFGVDAKVKDLVHSGMKEISDIKGVGGVTKWVVEKFMEANNLEFTPKIDENAEATKGIKQRYLEVISRQLEVVEAIDRDEVIDVDKRVENINLLVSLVDGLKSL